MIEHVSFVEQVYLKNTPKQQRGEVSFDPSNAQVEGVADRPEGVCLTPVDFHGLPFRVICYSLLCNPAPLLCDLFRMYTYWYYYRI